MLVCPGQEKRLEWPLPSPVRRSRANALPRSTAPPSWMVSVSDDHCRSSICLGADLLSAGEMQKTHPKDSSWEKISFATDHVRRDELADPFPTGMGDGLMGAFWVEQPRDNLYGAARLFFVGSNDNSNKYSGSVL